MNDIDDPRRLFESDLAPTGLRGLLARAHADVPSDAMAAQLVRAVECRGQMQTPAHGHGMRRSWVGRHSTKILLAAAVVGVGVGGAAYWHGSSNRANAERVPTPSAVPSERPALPVAPSASQAIAATNTVEAPIVLRPSAVAKASATPRSRTGSQARTGRSSSSAPETDTAVSSGTAVATTSADEYRLLRAARQALADHPARALDLADEHTHRFAHGMLAQEREAIAVEALVQLGREGQAKTRAQAFFVSYPSSPYRSRVEHVLGRAANKP